MHTHVGVTGGLIVIAHLWRMVVETGTRGLVHWPHGGRRRPGRVGRGPAPSFIRTGLRITQWP